MNDGSYSSLVVLQAMDTLEPSVESRFERFLCQEREALVKFLRTRLPTEEDAQDAAQESMARLVRYRDTEPEQVWKRLLFRIAVNVAHDQQRYARSHHVAGHVSYLDTLDATSADEPSQDERLAQQQMLAELVEYILDLPPRCQEIFLLNRVEGMTYVQVAKHCGISLKAVEKHMTKALAVLRKRLGKRGWEAL